MGAARRPRPLPPGDDARLLSLLEEDEGEPGGEAGAPAKKAGKAKGATKPRKRATHSSEESGGAGRGKTGHVVHMGYHVAPPTPQDEAATEERIRAVEAQDGAAAARLQVEEEARRLITPRLPAALASVTQRCIDTGDPRALDGTLKAMGWRSPDDGEREAEHWARSMGWQAGGYEGFAGLPQLPDLPAEASDDAEAPCLPFGIAA